MIQLRVLGAVDLRNGDGQSVHTLLAQPKRVALLALLCTHSGDEFVRRDVIASLFWPELDHEHARAGLRTGLHSLRRALGDVIVTRGNDEAGVTPDAIWCDAVAFEKACDAEQWQDALDLYHGEFLAGMHVQDSSAELDRWIEQQRSHYRKLATNAAWQLSAIEERRGNVTVALELGRRAVAWNGPDEVGVRRLLSLHNAFGDRAGAVAAFEAFSDKLRADLEVEPSAETIALIDEVRRGTRISPITARSAAHAGSALSGALHREAARRWGVPTATVAVILAFLLTAWSLSHGRIVALPSAPPSGNVAELASNVRGFLRLGAMPMPLSNMSAVYDAARDNIYVFGGRAGRDITSDLLTMDNPSRIGSDTWTRVEPRGRTPQPRYSHTAIYDSTTDKMIVFGGAMGFTLPCANDVWVLKNASGRAGVREWTEVTPAGHSPSRRGDHAAVWIPRSHRMIVFGGHDCVARRTNDVWALDMGEDLGRVRWHRIANSGLAPAPRSHHSMIYDEHDDRVLLFGGGVDSHIFDDVWELKPASTDSARWRALRILGADRPKLHAHRAVWDPVGRAMIVLGGTDSTSVYSTGIWLMRDEGDGAVRWSRLVGLPRVPPGRIQPGVVYVSSLDELIVFGGQSPDAVLLDAWALMNSTERRLARQAKR